MRQAGKQLQPIMELHSEDKNVPWEAVVDRRAGAVEMWWVQHTRAASDHPARYDGRTLNTTRSNNQEAANTSVAHSLLVPVTANRTLARDRFCKLLPSRAQAMTQRIK